MSKRNYRRILLNEQRADDRDVVCDEGERRWEPVTIMTNKYRQSEAWGSPKHPGGERCEDQAHATGGAEGATLRPVRSGSGAIEWQLWLKNRQDASEVIVKYRV